MNVRVSDIGKTHSAKIEVNNNYIFLFQDFLEDEPLRLNNRSVIVLSASRTTRFAYLKDTHSKYPIQSHLARENYFLSWITPKYVGTYVSSLPPSFINWC